MKILLMFFALFGALGVLTTNAQTRKVFPYQYKVESIQS